MRPPPHWPLYLSGCFVILCGGVGLYAARREHQAASAESILVATIAQAKVTSAHDSTAHVAAVAKTDVARDTMHARIAAYQKVRAAAVLKPVTRADTAKALAQLPELARTADAAISGCMGFETGTTTERTAAATLDAGRVHTIATQDTLIQRLSYRPRLSGVGAFLYDPIAKVPRLAVEIDVRTAGRWEIGARVEHRFVPGESPRALAVVTHPLF